VPIYENVIILIPAGIRHREYSQTKLDTIWIGLKGELFDSFSTEIQHLCDNTLARKFHELWLFARRNYGMIGPELDGWSLNVIGHFQRLIQEGSSRQADNFIEKAVQYINEHFNEPIDISELAGRFNCSEGHFFRLFKKRTGLTPISYLTNIRIQNAAHWLLNSNLTIIQISELAGYHDQFYFSRVFKKNMHLSPTHYRQKNGKI